MNIISPSFGLKLLVTAVFLIFRTSAGCTNEKSTLPPATCPAPTAPNVIANGDFECGFAPWTVQIPDPAANYYIGTPGYLGNFSFQVHFTPPAISTEYGVSARIITAPATVQPNVPYQLVFWTWFDNGDAGFIGVMINDVAVYTIDARDHGYGGPFTSNIVNYTPTNDTVTIKFEFLFGNVASWDRIDSVTFSPA
ncbi:hypothetical protein GGS24DRAFT_500322 [Hypoxylon argillaceum]|nr:hypothetical protein GGS24DRAFT_500322 [Hypoxylon argillaceum]